MSAWGRGCLFGAADSRFHAARIGVGRGKTAANGFFISLCRRGGKSEVSQALKRGKDSYFAGRG